MIYIYNEQTQCKEIYAYLTKEQAEDLLGMMSVGVVGRMKNYGVNQLLNAPALGTLYLDCINKIVMYNYNYNFDNSEDRREFLILAECLLINNYDFNELDLSRLDKEQAQFFGSAHVCRAYSELSMH